jgi:hypothetical protein
MKTPHSFIYWQLMHCWNVIILRWRMIACATLVTVALASLYSYAALPLYKSTCTIRNSDSDGFLGMEFYKRHPNAVIIGY